LKQGVDVLHEVEMFVHSEEHNVVLFFLTIKPNGEECFRVLVVFYDGYGHWIVLTEFFDVVEHYGKICRPHKLVLMLEAMGASRRLVPLLAAWRLRMRSTINSFISMRDQALVAALVGALKFCFLDRTIVRAY